MFALLPHFHSLGAFQYINTTRNHFVIAWLFHSRQAPRMKILRLLNVRKHFQHPLPFSSPYPPPQRYKTFVVTTSASTFPTVPLNLYLSMFFFSSALNWFREFSCSRWMARGGCGKTLQTSKKISLWIVTKSTPSIPLLIWRNCTRFFPFTEMLMSKLGNHKVTIRQNDDDIF